MTVLICGPLFYHEAKEDKEKLLSVFDQKIGDAPARLLFISHGEFDAFAAECAKQYQATHPEVQLIFVSPTPVVAHDYQMLRLELKNDLFDEILCPVDPIFSSDAALALRNRWIVNEADFLIAYVPDFGADSHKICQYAYRKGKEVVHLTFAFLP